MRRIFFVVTALTIALCSPAGAQTVDDPEVAACKATGLLALKQTSPTLTDIVLDMDSVTVAKANTKIEDTPIRTIIQGEVYLERKGTGKSQRFLCIIGEKGKVLLTYFTAR